MVYHGLPCHTVRVWWWAAWARRVSEVKNEISAKVVYRPLHCTRVTLGGVGVHWRAVGATMVDFRNISKIAYFTLLVAHAALHHTHGVARKAVADHDSDLRDEICAHIPPQAPQWLCAGTPYSIGWALDSAVRPTRRGIQEVPSEHLLAPPLATSKRCSQSCSRRALVRQGFFVRMVFA